MFTDLMKHVKLIFVTDSGQKSADCNQIHSVMLLVHTETVISSVVRLAVVNFILAFTEEKRQKDPEH